MKLKIIKLLALMMVSSMLIINASTPQTKMTAESIEAREIKKSLKKLFDLQLMISERVFEQNLSLVVNELDDYDKAFLSSTLSNVSNKMAEMQGQGAKAAAKQVQQKTAAACPTPSASTKTPAVTAGYPVPHAPKATITPGKMIPLEAEILSKINDMKIGWEFKPESGKIVDDIIKLKSVDIDKAKSLAKALVKKIGDEAKPYRLKGKPYSTWVNYQVWGTERHLRYDHRFTKLSEDGLIEQAELDKLLDETDIY